MKKPILPLSQCALLVACLMAGMAHAQSINLTGDTNPTGNLGASYSGADMVVGDTATGRMDVLAGAVLNNSGTTNVGNSAGSAGTVRMSGASQWNASAMYVGRAGTGTVNISEGAKLVSTDGHIGQERGSVGTVTLDGAGTSWTIPATANGDLIVGNNGAQGILRISNGATATTPKDLYAGFSPAGSTWNPYVTSGISISDANSALAVNGLCSLGSPNPLSVSIVDGGNMECGGAAILTRGQIGLARAGSHFSVGSNLEIGTEAANSEGSLGIAQQASVDVAGDLLLPNVTNPRVLTKGTLNISGYDTPGVLNAQRVVFGANGQGLINFTHVDKSGNYVFATPITGPGKVLLQLDAITTLSGNNDYTGNTDLTFGELRAGSDTGLSRGSQIVMNPGTTLDTATYSPTVSAIANEGVINMLAGGTSTALTVGVYGSGIGTIRMNTALGDSNSPTQRLVVTSNASPGNTILDITNLGGVGAPTTGNGILVVQVDGTSNHTFSLPAPGYLEAGGIRYELVKSGNNWYLGNNERTEAASVEASVACTPSQLGGSAGLVATCTVSLSVPLGLDMPINLNLPATSPRYTSTCASPLVIAANATQASCTITAVAATNESDVMAELSIAPPSVADAYAVGGVPAQVQILGNGSSRPGAGAHAVPTMGTVGLVAMASLMGLLGLRRSRKHNGRQG